MAVVAADVGGGADVRDALRTCWMLNAIRKRPALPCLDARRKTQKFHEPDAEAAS